MRVVPALLYAAAAAVPTRPISLRASRAPAASPPRILGAALLAHTFLIGMQTVQAGHAPLVGTTAAVSAFVWLLGLSYLYVELASEERSMGVFVTSLLALLAIIPALDPSVSPRPARAAEPAVHDPHRERALRLRQLRAGLGARAHLRPAVQGDQARSTWVSSTRACRPCRCSTAMNGRAVTVGWLFLTARHRDRRLLGDAGRGLARSARAGDDGRRSQDPGRRS